MKSAVIFIALVFILITSFIEYDAVITKPAGWPEPIQSLPTGENLQERITLGRVLFYDPILSGDNTISCASCHSPYNAFAHTDHKLSHGIHDSIGTRNAPALMNLAWQRNFMWDGKVNRLLDQVAIPIAHPAEMGETMQHVVLKLQQSSLYKNLFFSAYKDSLANTENATAALSDFLLTLISNNSKYDSVMQHTASFTQQEKSGYKLFQKNCTSCHTEPLFTNGDFANNGLFPDTVLNDKGRMSVTGKNSDQYKFRVPTLRNIEYSFPYMHDGRYRRLRDVLNHYSGNKYASE